MSLNFAGRLTRCPHCNALETFHVTRSEAAVADCTLAEAGYMTLQTESRCRACDWPVFIIVELEVSSVSVETEETLA